MPINLVVAYQIFENGGRTSLRDAQDKHSALAEFIRNFTANFRSFLRRKRTRSSGPENADPGTPWGRLVWGKTGVQNNRSRGARELTERLKIESLNFGAIVAPLSNPFFAPLRRSLTNDHLDSRRAASRR